MALFFKGENGKKDAWLLNSWEKSDKYAKDLKGNGKKDPNPKSDKFLSYGLSDKEKAYRAGYLACSRDKADEYLLDKREHGFEQLELNRAKISKRRQKQAERRKAYEAKKSRKEIAAKETKKSTKAPKKENLEVNPEYAAQLSEQVKMDVKD